MILRERRSSGLCEWINKIRTRTIGRFENKNLNDLVDKNANTKSVHEKATAGGAKETCLREVGRKSRARLYARTGRYTSVDNE